MLVPLVCDGDIRNYEPAYYDDDGFVESPETWDEDPLNVIDILWRAPSEAMHGQQRAQLFVSGCCHLRMPPELRSGYSFSIFIFFPGDVAADGSMGYLRVEGSRQWSVFSLPLKMSYGRLSIGDSVLATQSYYVRRIRPEEFEW